MALFFFSILVVIILWFPRTARQGGALLQHRFVGFLLIRCYSWLIPLLHASHDVTLARNSGASHRRRSFEHCTSGGSDARCWTCVTRVGTSAKAEDEGVLAWSLVRLGLEYASGRSGEPGGGGVLAQSWRRPLHESRWRDLGWGSMTLYV